MVRNLKKKFRSQTVQQNILQLFFNASKNGSSECISVNYDK